MRTLIELGNSNCPWCLNSMVDDLRASPHVFGVRSNAAYGCLEVDHDLDDPADVVVIIRDDLRGSIQASNGEVTMIELHPHPSAECPVAPK